jgi:hypothetical protein
VNKLDYLAVQLIWGWDMMERPEEEFGRHFFYKKRAEVA